MAKTYKHLFEQVANFQNLLLASQKAQKGKRYRESTLAFNFDLERNLFQLRQELLDRTYHPGSYRDFLIRDSKKRIISAAPYRDRVVHHALMNVVDPLLDRTFIFDTYACRKGKGTHAALLRFRQHFLRHRYVLKCDIRKYFQSMDHDILLSKLRKKIADKDVMWLLEQIVGSKDFNLIAPRFYYPDDDLLTPDTRRRGIPVGNLTSQFFANLYLNDFDHWLTEVLRVGPYLRYVDDFCVFGDSKAELNEVRHAIIDYLGDHRLRLHKGKSRIYTAKEGVEFLGFRHLPALVRVRRENIKRFTKRMKLLQAGYAAGEVSLDRIRASLVSWMAHANYANSYRLRAEMIPSFVFVKREWAEQEPRASGW